MTTLRALKFRHEQQCLKGRMKTEKTFSSYVSYLTRIVQPKPIMSADSTSSFWPGGSLGMGIRQRETRPGMWGEACECNESDEAPPSLLSRLSKLVETCCADGPDPLPVQCAPCCFRSRMDLLDPLSSLSHLLVPATLSGTSSSLFQTEWLGMGFCKGEVCPDEGSDAGERNESDEALPHPLPNLTKRVGLRRGGGPDPLPLHFALGRFGLGVVLLSSLFPLSNLRAPGRFSRNL